MTESTLVTLRTGTTVDGASAICSNSIFFGSVTGTYDVLTITIKEAWVSRVFAIPVDTYRLFSMDVLGEDAVMNVPTCAV